MLYDDRLGTVLRLPASGEALANAQYRQLIDLLGAMPASAWSDQVESAYRRLAELGRLLSPSKRARIVAQHGARLRNPRLVAALAGAETAVAEAAVAHARLTEEQWLDLLPALPTSARMTLLARTASDDRLGAILQRLGLSRTLPPAEQARSAGPGAKPEPVRVLPASSPPASRPAASVTRIDDRLRADRRSPLDRAREPGDSATGDAIRAIVRRIEEFRKVRHPSAIPQHEDAPLLPLGDLPPSPGMELTAFDFATDEDGVVIWANGTVAPMIVGRRLGEQYGGQRLSALIRQRQPLRGLRVDMDGAPAITGCWRLDAAPSFHASSGRFTGYSGRMRRMPASAGSPAFSLAGNGANAAGNDRSGIDRPGVDRMRQILHELRNPVGGIQASAEVMQQAIFGRIPHEYRALAATIAAEAARIIAALEEFDRLVRLTGGALGIEDGECDLAAIVRRLVAQLDAYNQPRGSGFALDIEDDPLLVPFDVAAMERMLWRLLAALSGCTAPGEMLRLKMRRKDASATLSIRLPGRLSEQVMELPVANDVDPGTGALSAGAFGAGFAIRLAAAEARAAGGHLDRKAGKLRLTLPGLTGNAMPHSQKTG